MLQKVKYLTLILVLFVFAPVLGTIHLPSIFSNNMVLQRNAEVCVWGWASSGEQIKVKVDWHETTFKTKADKDGKWSLKISTPEAGGPYKMKISGSVTIVYNNVMIGEVWLCSGQSNMGFSARSGLLNADEEVAAANYPNIRLFKVERAQADEPAADCKGRWVECNPETMARFSSVGYFFGKGLHEEMNVPVGLIESTWGGTSIELWTGKEVIYNDSIALLSAKTATKWPIQHVGTMFNAMISPLIPYSIAGAIWYQGESNRYKYDAYAHLMELLVNNWRKSWGSEFPFYYVQIAPFEYDEPYTGALIREQQLKALRIPNSGMVVTMDVGDAADVHPINKKPVGDRLYRLALNQKYGFKNQLASGPVFSGFKSKGNSITIEFKNEDDGLKANGGPLSGFEIAGENRVFYPATARILGNTVVVKSNMVKKAAAVRYGFHNAPKTNLQNFSGLPASPFRTDDWPVDTQKKGKDIISGN